MGERVPDTAAEAFDALGADYERVFADIPARDEALSWLTDRLPAHARVLDAGCGTGRPAAAVLAAAGCEVTGIDVSSAMVALARGQVPGARFEQADVRDFEPPAGGYHAVVAFFSLLQMGRAELGAVLSRIAGWLVPGGYFVLMTVPGDFEDLHVDFLGRRIVVTSWTEDDWVRRLGEAGLEVVRSGTSVHVPAEGMTEEHLTCLARRPGGTPAA
ncbi:class I SAM-dependent methyltransferase [Streptomyces zhihengii]|uniref:class I SAM-dependent methyltransferase n=1 Tax=Streptomyces zhihengii TaxID=1818004 RepID=UPI003457084F